MNNASTKGFVAVIGGAIAIGTAAIFMRYADQVSPTASAFWRVTLALPLLYIWLRFDKKSQKQLTTIPKRTILVAVTVVGFWFSVDLFFWHWSVDETTVANATLLANMATIFVALIGFVFFGERFGRRFVGGLVLSVFGAIALVGQSAQFSPENLFGDLLALATAVSYAGYIIYAAKVRGSLTTAMVMFGSAVTTAVFLLPIALLQEGALFPTDLEGWLPLLGLAWIAHVLGQSLIIYGLAHIPAALGSVTLLTQPVVSAILAWWLFSEALGLGHLIEAILIFGGIALAKSGSKKEKSPQPRKATG